MSTPCRVCETSLDESEAHVTGICAGCRHKLGIVEMPPPRRAARPCVACNGMRFIRVIPREYTYYYVKSAVYGLAAPMMLTRLTGAKSRWVFPGKKVPVSVNLDDGRGLLETYTCARCGHVEWYCADVETIPIGPEFMSDIVDYEPDKPFR